MIEIIDLSSIKLSSFDWDKGNLNKNWKKRKITNEETEQIFFNEPLKVFEDLKHSKTEKRLVAYGKTDECRSLTVVFTLRQGRIRVISARNQSRKERPMKKLKPMPQFKNEDEERNFWAVHDTIDYFDIDKPVKLSLSSLKKTTKPITIRLPVDLINRLKIVANKKDVPYQSLLKIMLSEKLKEEAFGYNQ